MKDVWEDLAANLTYRKPWKYHNEEPDTKEHTAKNHTKKYTAKDLESFYYDKGDRRDGLNVDNERDLRHHCDDLKRRVKKSCLELGMPAGPPVTCSREISHGFRLVVTDSGFSLNPFPEAPPRSNTKLNE